MNPVEEETRVETSLESPVIDYTTFNDPVLYPFLYLDLFTRVVNSDESFRKLRDLLCRRFDSSANYQNTFFPRLLFRTRVIYLFVGDRNSTPRSTEMGVLLPLHLYLAMRMTECRSNVSRH